MNTPFRLSRLSHPRATAGAVALLIAAFLIFGAIAEAHIQAKSGHGLPLTAEETLLLADNQGGLR